MNYQLPISVLIYKNSHYIVIVVICFNIVYLTFKAFYTHKGIIYPLNKNKRKAIPLFTLVAFKVLPLQISCGNRIRTCIERLDLSLQFHHNAYKLYFLSLPNRQLGVSSIPPPRNPIL